MKGNSDPLLCEDSSSTTQNDGLTRCGVGTANKKLPPWDQSQITVRAALDAIGQNTLWMTT